MYVLIEWEGEGLVNVYHMSKILKPRKEYKAYHVGEKISAKFAGKMYDASILQISENRKELEECAKGRKSSGHAGKTAVPKAAADCRPRPTQADKAMEQQTDTDEIAELQRQRLDKFHRNITSSPIGNETDKAKEQQSDADEIVELQRQRLDQFHRKISPPIRSPPIRSPPIRSPPIRNHTDKAMEQQTDTDEIVELQRQRLDKFNRNITSSPIGNQTDKAMEQQTDADEIVELQRQRLDQFHRKISPPIRNHSTFESLLPPKKRTIDRVYEDTEITRTYQMDKEESFATKEELKECREEIKRLKKKLLTLTKRVDDIEYKKVESPIDEEDSPEEVVPGKTMAFLKKKVSHLGANSLYECVKVLAKEIFTPQELMQSSISGKRSVKSDNNNIRPPLDPTAFAAFETIMREKDPNISHRWVVEKLQSVQKVLRRKNLCNY